MRLIVAAHAIQPVSRPSYAWLPPLLGTFCGERAAIAPRGLYGMLGMLMEYRGWSRYAMIGTLREVHRGSPSLRGSGSPAASLLLLTSASLLATASTSHHKHRNCTTTSTSEFFFDVDIPYQHASTTTNQQETSLRTRTLRANGYVYRHFRHQRDVFETLPIARSSR